MSACPSRLARIGVVFRCQDPAGHPGRHRRRRDWWDDEHPDALPESIPQVDAARIEAEFAACRQRTDAEHAALTNR